MPLPRHLFVGLDGGTWDLLEPAVQAGWLPSLGKFLAQSARGTLQSVDPPVTIPAWYSAVTGLSPATLGAWGFTAPTSAPGKFSLVTTYRPHEALWDLLGRRGWKVGVVNFPALPAPTVNGYFISGMIPARGAGTTFPATLADRLDNDFGGWTYDLVEGGGTRSHASLLADAARSLDQKALAVETKRAKPPRTCSSFF